jgi:hypothetical protein
MTYECKAAMETAVKKVTEELAEKYAEKLGELGEKYVRSHIRDDLLEEYVNWIMASVFYPLEYVMYYGMESAKTLAIPDDYARSAAGLCLYLKLDTPVDAYHDALFGCFFRMIDNAKKIQKGKSFDIAGKIENAANQKFAEAADKCVYFGQARQKLPNALKVRELCVDNLFINIAEYESRDKALLDGVASSGANITPEMETIEGEQKAVYNVNASYVGKTPVTVSLTFVKDNFRISLTAKCPDYVVRGIDYPANACEMGDYIRTTKKRIEEEGVAWEDIDREYNIGPQDEFVVKYSTEILATQQKIEDIIMKL